MPDDSSGLRTWGHGSHPHYYPCSDDTPCGTDRLLELELHVLGRVLARLPARESYAILDADCDQGGMARTRLPRLDVPFQCLGVDRCADAVAQARKDNHDPRFLFSCANIDELDPQDYGSFDIIFTSAALAGAPDPVRILQRLWELLSPGGALVVRALDDDMHSIHPPSSDLELLLQSTAALTRGTDRHFARKLPARLLQLSPAPADLFMEFKVDNTAGLDTEERLRLFDEAFAFREKHAQRVLRLPEASATERDLALRILETASRQRNEFAEDPNLFFAIAHSVAVAFK